MNRALAKLVEEEIARGEAKWGKTDTNPYVLISAATEELGEVAHAINHGEGSERTRQEIAEVIGVLARLYDMVEVYQAPAPIKVTLGLIIKRVSSAFKISTIDLKRDGRTQHLVQARQVAMYLMRQETDCSLREISKEMGRCEATVSYAYGKIAAEMQKDPELRRKVLNIQYSLRARQEVGNARTGN